ncbi:hypothetical protein ACQR3P_29495 [Rhodococcus sp. IEGM1300]
MPVPTRLQFETYGMYGLDNIPASAWEELEGPITIHMYSEEVKVNPRIELSKREMTYLLTQTDDIVPTGDLKKVEVNLTGPARMLVSTDNGVTWMSYQQDWVTVDKTLLQEVQAAAMTKEALALIPQEKWAGRASIRFAFLVELVEPADVVTLTSVKLTTIPDAATTPSVGMVGFEVKELSIEGRMKELERMNSIQLAKLNFKAGAILGADQLMLHNMQVDTFDANTATTLEVESGISKDTALMAAEGSVLEDGTLYAVSVTDSGESLKKVEVV